MSRKFEKNRIERRFELPVAALEAARVLASILHCAGGAGRTLAVKDAL